jgi:hypothetical protein
MHQAGPAAEALRAIFVVGEGAVEDVAANGATTAGTAHATAKTTETDLTSGTNEAASENETEIARGSASVTETGRATNATAPISLELGDLPRLHYELDLRHRGEISETQETLPRESMLTEEDEAPGTDRCRLGRPTRTLCLPLPRSVAALGAVEEEVQVADVAIGTRERAETAGPSMTNEIAMHAAGRRKADGDGSRKSGIAETAGTRTQPGTFATSATSGTESAKLSARSPTEYRTNRPLPRMSHPRPSPPPRPRSAQCLVASRQQPPKYSP